MQGSDIANLVKEQLSSINNEIREVRKEVDEVRSGQVDMRRDFEHAINGVEQRFVEALHKQTVETLTHRTLLTEQFGKIERALTRIETENATQQIKELETEHLKVKEKFDERIKSLENFRWYAGGVIAVLLILVGYLSQYLIRHLS